jgi:hypothetical protein
MLLLSTAAAAAAQPTPPPLSPAWGGRTFPDSWSLFQAMKAEAKGGEAKTAATLPDWSGVWTKSFGGSFFAFGDGQPQNPRLPPGYGLPAGATLTPAYAAKWEKKVADVAKGVEWDQLSECLPAGFPRWLTEPFLREFILRPEQAWLTTEQQSEVRRIYTDGRGHIADDEAYPMWEGDSVGFWDGDTLVVHTNNLKAGQYQRGQPDYSDKTTTVERIRQVSPGIIQGEVWVYDPESLVGPWRVSFKYEKVRDPVRIAMWSCAENNNVVKTADGGSDFVLPGEPGYRAPDALGKAPE